MRAAKMLDAGGRCAGSVAGQHHQTAPAVPLTRLVTMVTPAAATRRTMATWHRDQSDTSTVDD